jgi:nucleoside-diphosphate-sugar epimerase
MFSLLAMSADPADLAVVVGASGGVGNALVRALCAEGRPVRAVSRTATPGQARHDVRHVAANVSTADGASAACAGATTVFLAAQPPYSAWPQRFPAMVEHVIAGAAAARAKLVMVDNLYVYGPHSGPLREDTARAATGPKGSTRIAMENQLLAAHRSGRVRVSIGRLSDYYGPRGLNSALSALVLQPAVRSKPMRWPGSADVARTLHYLGDAARGLLVLGDHDRADGEVWHLPAAPPLTGREFMELVNTALPQRVKAKSLSAMSMRIGGLFSKDAKESVEVMYQWTDPFVSDTTKFVETFGSIDTTPHATGVAETVRWMLDEWLPNLSTPG